MTRESRKEIIQEMNKDAIINASEALMAKHPLGLEQVTMDEIAKASDFTKRTIYSYFQSKEEIYVTICIRGFIKLHQLLKEVIDPKVSGLKQVELFGKEIIKFSEEDPLHFYATIDYVPNQYSNTVREEFLLELFNQGEVSIHYLIDSIKKGVLDKSIKNVTNIEETAFSIWAMLVGLLSMKKVKASYLSQTYGIDLTNWLNSSLDIILNSLKGARI